MLLGTVLLVWGCAAWEPNDGGVWMDDWKPSGQPVKGPWSDWKPRVDPSSLCPPGQVAKKVYTGPDDYEYHCKKPRGVSRVSSSRRGGGVGAMDDDDGWFQSGPGVWMGDWEPSGEPVKGPWSDWKPRVDPSSLCPPGQVAKKVYTGPDDYEYHCKKPRGVSRVSSSRRGGGVGAMDDDDGWFQSGPGVWIGDWEPSGEPVKGPWSEWKSEVDPSSLCPPGQSAIVQFDGNYECGFVGMPMGVGAMASASGGSDELIEGLVDAVKTASPAKRKKAAGIVEELLELLLEDEPASDQCIPCSGPTDSKCNCKRSNSQLTRKTVSEFCCADNAGPGSCDETMCKAKFKSMGGCALSTTDQKQVDAMAAKIPAECLKCPKGTLLSACPSSGVGKMDMCKILDPFCLTPCCWFGKSG